ncbi:MAG: TonB-dependent siderophore receptor [Xylophilus sp.]|nr:TonB-dependent siderophore receptor [Xylophilus sp.]
MKNYKPNWPLSPIQRALSATFLIASPVWAQTGASLPSDATTLAPITVQSSTAPLQADVSGFGDLPLREVPMSITVVGQEQLQASGARRLADLTQFDASLGDAYNSAGYWDYLSIRGFTLDNRFNYRREGLPISAETSIPLDNKERVEILKGTSGIQVGTSAPGGLVNFVVKRPTPQNMRDVRLEATSRDSLLAAVDLGGRAGVDQVFGYRFNVAQERLRPRTFNLDGERSLVALATDWRINRDTLLEAELEWSRKSQPSQNGFSLLGDTLPSPVDPRINLNNQPWSQPSVFEALTGSLRLEQAINSDWSWSAQLANQRLTNQDRLAYAFGCSTEGNYDRYCSDGSYDMYDFRSENERRTQQAARLQLKGRAQTGAVAHDLGFSVMTSQVRNRFQNQAYNWVGYGQVDGSAITPEDPSLTTESTNRDERSLEFAVQDAIRWNERFTTWVGLRHTRLSRDSVGTDGSSPTGYDESLTTPWLAASYSFAPGHQVYASYGEGVESQIVPNKAGQYSNAGVALPSLKSKQWELGIRGEADGWKWQAAWFRIERPMTNLDACARLFTTPCLGQYDGSAVHQGLEASTQWTQGAWRLDGGILLLDAKRQGSIAEPATNGQRPPNVPRWTLRSQAAWRVAGVPGLELQGRLSHEARRAVLPDASIQLPAWTRVDAALRYDTRINTMATTWTLGVDNLLGKRYWKESPYQYGHVYLFPGSPRTFRVTFQASL